jgi:uncharacterized protein
MHIQLESHEIHSIQSYTNDSIKINGIIYQKSIIVSRNTIITDVNVERIQELNEEHLKDVINQNPNIVIIGHQENISPLTMPCFLPLLSNGIAVEPMTVGAACRTYNVLLNEHREVVCLFIFHN